MKLNIYDKTQDILKKNIESTAFFNLKAGTIYFSKTCSAALGIKKGDCIKLAQDEEKPKDWFFIPCEEKENSFIVSSVSETTKKDSLKIHGTKLIETIFKSLNFEGISCKISIATIPTIHEGKEIFAILTKSLNQDKK